MGGAVHGHRVRRLSGGEAALEPEGLNAPRAADCRGGSRQFSARVASAPRELIPFARSRRRRSDRPLFQFAPRSSETPHAAPENRVVVPRSAAAAVSRGRRGERRVLRCAATRETPIPHRWRLAIQHGSGWPGVRPGDPTQLTPWSTKHVVTREKLERDRQRHPQGTNPRDLPPRGWPHPFDRDPTQQENRRAQCSAA